MPIHYSKKIISEKEISDIVNMPESWLMDKKGKDIKPAKFSRTISAFANTNGGEIYLGISRSEKNTDYYWDGFADEEEMNPFIALLAELLPGIAYYDVELFCNKKDNSSVLHVIIQKTQTIIFASNKEAYRRIGVQNLPCDTPEKLLELKLDKGLASFEDEYTELKFEDIKNSKILNDFIKNICPQTPVYDWLRRQRVMDTNTKISVAGVLLYDECPQTVLPKQSGIRILRYLTDEPEGSRETLASGFPISIEGDIYSLICDTVNTVIDIVENAGVLGDSGNEVKKYPKVTLHEIITNAVLHRDYSITKDIQIRIFTNRIEVDSPGRLPGHITLANIMREQFARNPKIVRLISKFPSPPNKDVGEGLNTAFAAMLEMQLAKPTIEEVENSVVVTIKHERLADAETVVLDYLKTHSDISNSIARSLTGITDANKMKRVFNRLKSKGLLEIAPGTQSSATKWRLKEKVSTILPENELPLFF